MALAVSSRKAAAFLCLALLLAFPACGKKEDGSGPGISPEASGDETVASAAAETAAALPSGEREIVVIDPMTPCRAVPPGVSVKPVPGREKTVLGVRWIVNGSEASSDPRLSPERFRRGDRIQAVVTLRSGEVEKTVTTREIVAVNSPPAASSVRIDPAAPVSGGTVRAVVEARDADDDPLKIRYQWYVDNVPVSGDADRLELKGVKRGSWVHVRATPDDGACEGAWGESARYQVVNGLPVVKSDVPKEVPPGRTFVYRIEAEDPDGDPLAFKLKKGPPGMALNGSTLEWQIPEGYLGQPVEVVVEISDGQDARTVQNISMTIQPPVKSR